MRAECARSQPLLEVAPTGAHGREELRFGVVLTNLETIRDRALWTGLKSVVCVVSRRQVNGKDGREVRYYISSRRGSGVREASSNATPQ